MPLRVVATPVAHPRADRGSTIRLGNSIAQPASSDRPPVAALEAAGADTLPIGAARRRAGHLSPGIPRRSGVLHTIDSS
jgi:hypothetical protein